MSGRTAAARSALARVSPISAARCESGSTPSTRDITGPAFAPMESLSANGVCSPNQGGSRPVGSEVWRFCAAVTPLEKGSEEVQHVEFVRRRRSTPEMLGCLVINREDIHESDRLIRQRANQLLAGALACCVSSTSSAFLVRRLGANSTIREAEYRLARADPSQSQTRRHQT